MPVPASSRWLSLSLDGRVQVRCGEFFTSNFKMAFHRPPAHSAQRKATGQGPGLSRGESTCSLT
eukprot:3745254-Rhodomonas_salina.3